MLPKTSFGKGLSVGLLQSVVKSSKQLFQIGQLEKTIASLKRQRSQIESHKYMMLRRMSQVKKEICDMQSMIDVLLKPQRSFTGKRMGKQSKNMDKKIRKTRKN